MQLTKVLIITTLLISSLGIAQESTQKSTNHNLEFAANTSLMRLSGDATYRLNIRHFTLTAAYGYGQIAKKEFMNTNEQDGYNGAYSFHDIFSDYNLKGFEHNFIGHTVGIGIGYNFYIGSKHTLSLTGDIDGFLLKDHYARYYKYKGDKDIEEAKKIDRKTLSLGLSVNYYLELSDLLALKIGIKAPFVIPYFNSQAMGTYRPQSNSMPNAGLEPFLNLGLQLRL